VFVVVPEVGVDNDGAENKTLDEPDGMDEGMRNRDRTSSFSAENPVGRMRRRPSVVLKYLDGDHSPTHHGRMHLQSEERLETDFDDDDPEHPVVVTFLHGLEYVQELALPLIIGAIVAMAMANFAPDTYEYYFTSVYVPCPANSTSGGHRRGGSGCKADRFLLYDYPIFGHDVTLHFFANDFIMVFHFGLAMKEVTEALLPGGSLNPPSKALNPIITTLGGIIGPVGVFFVFLELFKLMGLFDPELDRGLTSADLAKGWGIVTATDIVLAWLVSRVVFGDGHPAIDYLLLLAVVDDAIGMAIIAIFYPDPENAVEPLYLLIVVAGMAVAFALRQWHYRKKYKEHQNWHPYIWLAGVLSWVGLIKTHLHPALAIIPIVPFMPGPEKEALDALDEKLEAEREDVALDDMGHGDGIPIDRDRITSVRDRALSAGTSQEDTDRRLAELMKEHHDHARGRAITIQAGLYGGLVGHGTEDALKVVEYDEDGTAHRYTTTLDSFEHFWKLWVDLGLGLFALVNAGVKVEKVGAMTFLILISLVVGKFTGILLCYKIAKKMGFYPPLGIRTRHIYMIGLIASIGLIVAIFVSEVAFQDKGLQGDAKLGALLSAMMAFVCFAIGRFVDYRHEDVAEQEMLQVLEELEQEEKRHPSDIKQEPSYRLTPTSSFAADLDMHGNDDEQHVNSNGSPATDNDIPLEVMKVTTDNALTTGKPPPRTPRSKAL